MSLQQRNMSSYDAKRMTITCLKAQGGRFTCNASCNSELQLNSSKTKLLFSSRNMLYLRRQYEVVRMWNIAKLVESFQRSYILDRICHAVYLSWSDQPRHQHHRAGRRFLSLGQHCDDLGWTPAKKQKVVLTFYYVIV